MTGGLTASSRPTRTTRIFDTVTRTWRDGRENANLMVLLTFHFNSNLLSATIPVDVVGRSTVQVGDDFVLVGASVNGESAPMLKWDSGNSEWIELEVRNGRK